MQNRVTKLLGIKYPIIQGGMVYIGKPPLSTAVSEAGGLGTIAAGGLTLEQFAQEIDRAKELTKNPFGANIPLVIENVPEYIRIAIEKQVPVVILSAGKPDKYIPALKGNGIKVMQVVPNVSMARKVEMAGVDAVIAEGFEGGGHMGHDELTTMVLIPQVVDAVKIPVIAAGGIADTRGFVAAMALGAEGVQLGTAFAASLESPAHENFKNAIYQADDKATVVTGRSMGMLVRDIKNDFTAQVLELERKGASREELLEFIGTGRAPRALLDGDMTGGSAMSGQIAGMIAGPKSVKEIIDGMVGGAEGILDKLQMLRKI